MRNLKECQAEVFRRSEIRIARRKRRRRLITVCVPVVLCIGGWLLLPKLHRTGSTELLQENAPSSIGQQTVRTVSVTGPNVSLQYTEQDQVQPIYDYILDLSGIVNTRQDPMAAPEGTDSHDYAGGAGLMGTDNNMVSDEADKHSGANAYTISVILADGSTLEYMLTDNHLTDRSTGISYLLSQAQKREFTELLDIANGKDDAP